MKEHTVFFLKTGKIELVHWHVDSLPFLIMVTYLNDDGRKATVLVQSYWENSQERCIPHIESWTVDTTRTKATRDYVLPEEVMPPSLMSLYKPVSSAEAAAYLL